MATLEKIRSKSVVLFAIIIIALLAFILGDFMTSGRTYFGSGDKMVEANGAKVKLDEFQTRMSSLGEQAGQTDQDIQEVNMLNGMLMEKLLDKQVDEAGINITNAELSKFMTNNQEVWQFVGQMSNAMGLQPAMDEAGMAANIKIILERLQNPAKYKLPADQAKLALQQWPDLEKNAEKQLRQGLYMQMVQGMYAANAVDAQAMYDASTTRELELVAIPLNLVDDNSVKLTDADIKAVWEKNKPQFRVFGDKRAVAYISQPVAPSQEDIAAAQKTVNEMMTKLSADSNSIAALQADNRFNVARGSMTRAQLDKNGMGKQLLSALADSGARVGKTALVQQIPGKFYIMAKLVGMEQKADSITVSTISFQDASLLAGLQAKAAAGAWDSLANDKVQVASKQDFSLLSIQDPKMAKMLADAPVGQVQLYTDSVQGQKFYMLYRVDKRNNPVTVYDIVRADYYVTPSNATVGKITGDFNTFLGNNANAKAFADNAAKAGYNVLNTQVTAGTPNIGGMPGTRSLVKFAMEGKEGQVSRMVTSKVRNRQGQNQAGTPALLQTVQMPDDEYLVAVALGDEYDDYVAWNDPTVKPILEAQARNLKKAQQLADKYKGKTGNLQALAAETRSSLMPMTYSFNTPGIPAEVDGVLAKTKDGATTAPIATEQGVFVIKVKKTNAPVMKLADTKDQMMQQFQRGFLPLNTNIGVFNALLGGKNIKNHTLNFKQGLDD